MPIEILMPALSPTMEEGTLAKWLKKEGDPIAAGDVIAEIETDKATMEFEATDEGVLGKILVADGTAGIKVNQPIGILLEEGEDASALAQATPAKAPDSPAKAAPEAVAAPSRSDAAPKRAAGERLFASPLARRIASAEGLDLAAVQGSGPHGRIVRRDVEAALASGSGKTAEKTVAAPVAPAAPAVAAVAPKPVALPDAPHTKVANTSMRKIIARRLTESKQTVPHFYLTVDCKIDALLDLRKSLNARAEKRGDGVKLSVNDLIIKAVALALRKVPAANASWSDEAIVLWSDVDISIAVATPGGLITPIVRKADQKGLATISAEMKDLATRARDGKLKPEEFQGGGFSISNLGMYGIRDFAAIINPPQGCILAIGAGEQRPVVEGGALAIATVMSCTLSVDHRVVDGAVGAEFLSAFKILIEDPMAMML
ncbi:pyruvate dehydrogenase complex dihydrolipoamide acetyltransferase [Rhodospirillum rubrum]|uniref:pyruvate dehydrogenase complex dihydrolipoamide acetyltransferase n=1 Tax=Rhodospirillum rubrum TaxID=1085 RepID=UPI0019077CFE|nr:pyruvate dehydrogenase complex dihydrolipoamide acetyltransferase [Rhodospirillum rubrum]MBK1663700.1 pyruvate dehydrogenase complex dihydrolipoamide acetyltransferase [Rhodospirillum rubrum]MBK1677440.1 pyruvate dehydrogenase complex dihydrolipoamide acetyltransferase [Rhodospirillum rubrum]